MKDSPSTHGSETVLLVDDEEAVRELVREVLQLHGYSVLEAKDRTQAEDLCRRHTGPIHLLVTDVILPKISGPDLAERLIRSKPEMRVLYMSGYADDAMVSQGILEPEAPFLQKPFTTSALALKVREILDR